MNARLLARFHAVREATRRLGGGRWMLLGMSCLAVAGTCMLASWFEDWYVSAQTGGLVSGGQAPPDWRLWVGGSLMVAGVILGPVTALRRAGSRSITLAFTLFAAVWMTGLVAHRGYHLATRPDGALPVAGQEVWAALDGRVPPLQAVGAAVSGVYAVVAEPYVNGFSMRKGVGDFLATRWQVPRNVGALLWAGLWGALAVSPILYRRVWGFLLWPPSGALRIQPVVTRASAGTVPPVCRADPNAFAELVGLDSAVEIVKAQVQTWLRGREAAQFGVTSAKGILLYGPPGTGKTSLARAAARYFGVNFLAVSPADLLASHVGETEGRVRALFAHARRLAPCVVFIDEVDGIGRRRDGEHRNRASDLVLPVLLQEMDGFAPLEGVLVLAATNRADVLDAALLRRFTYRLLIDKPSAVGRAVLLRKYLHGIPAELDFNVAAEELADLAPAEIRNACHALKEALWVEYLKTGRRRTATWDDLQRAVSVSRIVTTETLGSTGLGSSSDGARNSN